MMEYFLDIKRKEILIHVILMTLEDIRLSEISQSRKDKYCVIPFRGNTQGSIIHPARKNGAYQGLRARKMGNYYFIALEF